MAKDKVASTDQDEVGLITRDSAPDHPCPICGKGMKDANTQEDVEAGRNMRICSSRLCRAKANWTSGIGVLLNN